jgi:hypothetical protein
VHFVYFRSICLPTRERKSTQFIFPAEEKYPTMGRKIGRNAFFQGELAFMLLGALFA